MNEILIFRVISIRRNCRLNHYLILQKQFDPLPPPQKKISNPNQYPTKYFQILPNTHNSRHHVADLSDALGAAKEIRHLVRAHM